MNSLSSTPRQLSPYEYNHLKKWGTDPSQIAGFGSMPVEYITGHVTFCGFDFQVSPAILIPRIETEELVEYIVKDIKTLPPTTSVKLADIGCGSGAIGLSVLKKIQSDSYLDLHLWCGDISTAALQVAQANAKSLGVPNVTFIESNLLTSFPADQAFDVIVANLPYIPSSRISQLDESVKNHEPHLALDGGQDGLDLIAKLVSQLPNYLKPTGICWLEIDHTHQSLLEKIVAGIFTITFIKDQFGQTRFARLAYT